MLADPTMTCAARLREELGAQAEMLADQEPVLAAYLWRTVISAGSLEALVSAVLAGHFAGASHDWRALFEQTLKSSPDTLAALVEDLSATLRRDPASRDALSVVLNAKGFHALQAYRISHRLWLGGRPALAALLQGQASRVYGVDIHPAAEIGPGAMLDHATGIVIGETARVGAGVSLLQGVTLGGTGKERGERHPVVGAGVLIGAGATVLGRVSVGCDATVAAGSVVLRDVAAGSTVAGVPAVAVMARMRTVPSEDMDHRLSC